MFAFVIESMTASIQERNSPFQVAVDNEQTETQNGNSQGSIFTGEVKCRSRKLVAAFSSLVLSLIAAGTLFLTVKNG